MASGDAHPLPINGVAFRITFGIRKNDGTLITAAAGISAKVSLDGATFATCTNTPAEIATSSGVYYLDLTAAEMSASTTVLLVTSTTTGAIPTLIPMYPSQTYGEIPVDVHSINSSGTAAQYQAALANTVLPFTVDTATFTATVTDFETNLSIVRGTATNFYAGRSVLWTGNHSLTYQATRIVGSTLTGNSKIKLTVSAMTSAPANGAAGSIV